LLLLSINKKNNLESIESTVRKSRKQAGHGPISRYMFVFQNNV